METEQTKKCLKTKLKFKESKLTGELVAFAYWDRSKKALLGVNEEDQTKKKICILSNNLKEKNIVKPGILYSATVHLSSKNNSYIIDKAIPYKFKAKVETQIISKCFYQTIVSFGNEKIYYNPFDGKSEFSRTLEGVIGLLDAREDLLNKEETINAVKRSARTVNQYLEADGYILPTRKKAV